MKRRIQHLLFAIDDIPAYAVFLLTSLCGFISSIIGGLASTPVGLSFHFIFGFVYALGGILFLIIIRKKCWWNVPPAIIGIATALLCLYFVLPHPSTPIVDSLSNIVSSIAAPLCCVAYFPLLWYAVLVIDSSLGNVVFLIMGVLGVLLSVYSIHNIIANRPGRPKVTTRKQTEENSNSAEVSNAR